MYDSGKVDVTFGHSFYKGQTNIYSHKAGALLYLHPESLVKGPLSYMSALVVVW